MGPNVNCSFYIDYCSIQRSPEVLGKIHIYSSIFLQLPSFPKSKRYEGLEYYFNLLELLIILTSGQIICYVFGKDEKQKQKNDQFPMYLVTKYTIFFSIATYFKLCC